MGRLPKQLLFEALASAVAPGSLGIGALPRSLPQSTPSPVAPANMAEQEEEKPIKTLTAEDIRLLKTVSRAGRPRALGGAFWPLPQPGRFVMPSECSTKRSKS